jgi:uncharacterized SAM-binding protein YcdF (DUF218 family)
MGMIHRVGQWAGRFAALGLFSLLLVLGWTLLWPKAEIASLPKSAAIVCLGGGMSPDGTLHAPTKQRVRTCVDLYHAGHAPLIAFTGGVAEKFGPSAGDEMADYAASLGVPAKAIISEPRAQSTLQNALFTLPMLPAKTNLTLVTEAFHLPRSWASFRWAGAEDLKLVASENIRGSAEGKPQFTMVIRETAAIWFNLFRASLWSVGSAMGYENEFWLQ